MKPTTNEMPAEIDFSHGTRGLHHIPKGARVFVPTSIEEKTEAKKISAADFVEEVMASEVKSGDSSGGADV